MGDRQTEEREEGKMERRREGSKEEKQNETPEHEISSSVLNWVGVICSSEPGK